MEQRDFSNACEASSSPSVTPLLTSLLCDDFQLCISAEMSFLWLSSRLRQTSWSRVLLLKLKPAAQKRLGSGSACVSASRRPLMRRMPSASNLSAHSRVLRTSAGRLAVGPAPCREPPSS